MRKIGRDITGVVIYLRVSTDEQARTGLGLHDQEKRCRAWADAQGLEVVAVHLDDGVSARTLNRAGLTAAIDSLCPGRILVALNLSRLLRSVTDFPELHRRIEGKGGEWATVAEHYDTSTAMGRGMLHMALVFSQMERELIGERTSHALQAKRERGERLGATPYGFTTIPSQSVGGKRVPGTVVRDAHEQRGLALARELRAQRYSIRAIADALNEAGYRTKRGARWQARNTARLLKPGYVESTTRQ